MDAIIVGDSQTNVIRKAYLKARAERDGVPEIAITPLGTASKMLRPFFRLIEGRVEFIDADYTARLNRAARRRYLAEQGEQLTYGLCMGFHTARVCRNRCWRTHVPWQLSKSFPDLIPVTDGVITAILVNETQHIFGLYRLLKEMGADFFVIMAPPPQEKIVERYKVPVEIVLSVDEIYRSYVMNFADELGIPVIRPPVEAYDGKGLLKPCFWNEREADDRHGNLAYGELMLDQVLVHLKNGAQSIGSA